MDQQDAITDLYKQMNKLVESVAEVLRRVEVLDKLSAELDKTIPQILTHIQALDHRLEALEKKGEPESVQERIVGHPDQRPMVTISDQEYRSLKAKAAWGQ